MVVVKPKLSFQIYVECLSHDRVLAGMVANQGVSRSQPLKFEFKKGVDINQVYTLISRHIL